MMNSKRWATLTTTVLVFVCYSASAEVRWAPQLERGPGAGYNAKHYDKRVAQPRSILKKSKANRALKREQRMLKRLGPRTRAEMTHRGQVAKHARQRDHYKSTLNRTARKASNRAHTVKRTRTKANHVRKARNAAKVARTGKKARTVAKVAGGGLIAAGVAYGAKETLGVNVPDPIDAAEWSYHTLKNPKNAGKRFEKLGHDTVRETKKGWNTLKNPKKMERNIVRSANKTAKGVKKLGKKAKKFFGL